ncbi:hypothetical protein [Staphylococcus sp. 17KM0847]|uniref:hypothetical protein n=1 Tax=Staphylococcus sp. 17KM0847 TaxID=2583989 RepID=UPI0015DCDFED|nr:hypothetical protein [Staphylococcus sp. 17KM0847]QLK85496.1 hypothetical protein FGL66_01640 [Staphylococcus sp. 17KM0847]
MVIGYLVLFMLMMWLGQSVCQYCIKSQRQTLAYLWMMLVLIIQGVIIYIFVEQLVLDVNNILQSFYHEN